MTGDACEAAAGATNVASLYPARGTLGSLLDRVDAGNDKGVDLLGEGKARQLAFAGAGDAKAHAGGANRADDVGAVGRGLAGERNGLAIDLGGRTRLGPDAEWLPEGAKPPFDYEVDPKRAEHFYREVRRYWPGLKDGALSPDYSGVRPKIVGKGQPSADFLIDGPEAHGGAGLVNLIGLESPGLTSSLAVGEMAARLV